VKQFKTKIPKTTTKTTFESETPSSIFVSQNCHSIINDKITKEREREREREGLKG
jgi:hypothetical protein